MVDIVAAGCITRPARDSKTGPIRDPLADDHTLRVTGRALDDLSGERRIEAPSHGFDLTRDEVCAAKKWNIEPWKRGLIRQTEDWSTLRVSPTSRHDSGLG
ncbi:MAG: hypothetical protein ACXVX9_02885 [Mycobacteriaceae bacterium]